MKKKGKFKPGRRDGEFRSFKRYEKKPAVGSIVDLKDGDYFKGVVKIMRKAVPGPVVFSVSDGLKSVDAVTKSSDADVGDVVELSGDVMERAGKLQIEVSNIKPAAVDFEKIIERNSEPKDRPLAIKSRKLQIMKPMFLKVAKRIRKAILESQPILIRHHNDADGITSGLAIEGACRLLMEEVGVNADYSLFRSMSRAPYYDIPDMLKDISFTKRIIEAHGQKKPLIVVTDNGSTPEDVFAMRTLSLLGFDIIVIDHHDPIELKDKKTAVDPYIELHLNPYIFGLEGSKISAGMLCYEVGRLIHEDFDEKLYPAVTGISDHCDIPETDDYIKLTGLSKKKLGEIGIAIDFTSYNLKFDPGRGIYEEIYHNPTLVEMINEKVRKGFETQLQSTLPYLRTVNIKGVIFSHIDLEKYTLRFTFPPPGKLVQSIHGEVVKDRGDSTPIITIGHLSDMVIIRATHPILPVSKIAERLKRDLPKANIEGGGHEQAGSIKFVSAHLTAVIENIKKQIEEINYVETKKPEGPEEEIEEAEGKKGEE